MRQSNKMDLSKSQDQFFIDANYVSAPHQEIKTFKPKILQHNQTAFSGLQPKTIISEQTNQFGASYVPRPSDMRGLSDLQNVNSFSYVNYNSNSLPLKQDRSDSFNLLRDSATVLNSNGMASSFHSNESPF